ncbi:hypothetical protein DENSPDRAFT_843144 [Dentipellis sp. KUC8613]|nr:hypothetical protein DENSPDRAFT_843144 [Dentipellis sp. KUC8613]
MHRCFQIPELLDEIATKLLPAYDPRHHGFVQIKKGRRDVLALALTCKAFLEPSLDILWRDLDSMFPLLHVLDVIPTRDLWPDYRGSSTCRVYMSVTAMKELRLLAEAKWDRLDYYSPRVRSLLVDQYHPPVYKTMLQYHQKTLGSAVTPNLRSLVWRVPDEEHFGFIPFCGPNLAFLTIKPPNLEISAPKIAGMLGNSLSGLEELVFLYEGREETTRKQDAYVSNLVLYAPSLRLVKSNFHHPSPEAFARIVTMPHLETLTLSTLPPEPWPYLSPRAPASVPFLPAIRSLRLCRSRLDVISRFLQAVDNMKQLERLKIELHKEDRNTAVGGCIATVGNLCFAALVDFYLSPDQIHSDLADGRGRVDAFRVSQAMLSPLLPFKNMEECKIHVQSLDIDDTFLESVATSWPSLRVLVLLPLQWHKEESNLTLPGLLPLAKNCPHLYFVELNFNRRATAEDMRMWLSRMVRTWDHSETVGTLPGLDLWLRDLERSAGGQLREVAGRLKAVFPNVRSTADAAINNWLPKL